MKRLCDCGCRRPPVGEWHHDTLGWFQFAALCNVRNGDALRDTGWHYYAPLHEQPLATITGGAATRDCG